MGVASQVRALSKQKESSPPVRPGEAYWPILNTTFHLTSSAHQRDNFSELSITRTLTHFLIEHQTVDPI